jgi:protein O-mannosyl-transferase
MRLSQRQIFFLISAALVLTTLVAYEPIRYNGFVSYDDNMYITKNPDVKTGITWQSLYKVFEQHRIPMWHPLTMLSHMLDYQLFGLNPLGHHLVSVAIHIVNALLLFWIFNSMTGTIWLSAFVAGVFALHPLQVESVAWAAERKTVMSGLFWLLTMAVYIRYARQPGFSRYLAVLLVFGLCIMAKPIVVTLPLVLLLLDYWPLDRVRWGQPANIKVKSNQKTAGWLIAEKIPLLTMSAILSAITIIVQQNGQGIVSFDKIPLGQRITNMFASYISYIHKTIWPSGLAVYYPHQRGTIPTTTVVICTLLFILMSILCVYAGRRRKYIAIGWLWYVGTLVPVIGLVQSGAQMMANRYMYISMLGLLIIIGWGVKDYIEKQPRARIATIILGVAVLFSLLALTRMQVRHWQDTLTLFDYALKVTKDNPIAENSYGCALFELGREDEAEEHLRNAIRISSAFADARNNLAKVYLKEGRYSKAISLFNELIRQNEGTAEIYCNIAVALSMQNNYEDAIKYFGKSLELNRNDSDTHKKMGITLLAAGKITEAIGYLKESLRINADQADVYETIGKAYSQLGQYEHAMLNWKKALELQPNSADVLNNLGWLYATFEDATTENANKAIEYASRACELTDYNDAVYLDTLGTTYGAAGRFEEAKATAGKALSIATASGQEKLAGEIENRIKLYEAGQPYRQMQETNDKSQ